MKNTKNSPQTSVVVIKQRMNLTWTPTADKNGLEAI